jgi:CubicO group peptidase (beta-lactamase class C family)
MGTHFSFVRHCSEKKIPAHGVVGIIILALLAAGCETRQESLTKSRIRRVEKGLLRAIYLKGQQPEKLSLDTRMQFYKVPGVGIAVMDKFGLEWARGLGFRDSHSREPVTVDTIFQAGDVGQPVAAAAALALAAKGRLELDGNIGPLFRNWNVPWGSSEEKISLRQILTHTAGFPEEPVPGFSPDGLKATALKQYLEGLEPFSAWSATAEGVRKAEVRPSEAGFAVLQALLEDVTSTPFPSLMNEYILGPLGMRNSTFDVPLPEAMKINAASGHGRDGRPVEGKWLEYPAAAAAGFRTTPSDLLSFVAEILRTAMGNDGKVLSSNLARAMLTPQAGNRGYGFAVDGAGQDVRFHLEGRTKGFTCTLVVYPYKGQGVVVMTNSENGFLLTEEILQAVSAVYDWPDFKPRERPLYRLDPSMYQQYVGRYQVTPDYVLDVSSEDYYLVIRPSGQAPTKFYVESQTFFFSIDPYVRIQFLSDKEGRVTGLVLWQQDFKQEAKRIGGT